MQLKGCGVVVIVWVVLLILLQLSKLIAVVGFLGTIAVFAGRFDFKAVAAYVLFDAVHASV